MSEICVTLRALFAYSADLRYLALVRGVVQTLSTHIADPFVPLRTRMSAERTIMDAVLKSSDGAPALVAASVLPDGTPAPFPALTAALTGEPVTFAEDPDALLSRATALGVPVSNEMRMQLCVSLPLMHQSGCIPPALPCPAPHH